MLRVELKRMANAAVLAADQLPRGSSTRAKALVDAFWTSLAKELRAQLTGSALSVDDEPTVRASVSLLRKRLSARGLLLLEGLDEVLDPAVRVLVAELVSRIGESLAADHTSDCALLVTARPYVYPDCALEGFRVWRLQPLSIGARGEARNQAAELVLNWYRELGFASADATALIAALGAAGDVSSQGDVARAEMATRPLLLTLLVALALDRRRRGMQAPLPVDRAELMEEATKLFVQRWFERIRDLGRENISTDLLDALTQKPLREVLQRVSLKVQLERREASQDDQLESQMEVSADGFLGTLVRVVPAIGKEAKVAERLVLERAGVLFSRGLGRDDEPYGYVHRQFQEYLAACELVERAADRLGDRLGTALRASPGAWREVARFAVVRLAREHGPDGAITLVRALLAEPDAAQAPTDTAYQAAAAAGLALEDLRAALPANALSAAQRQDLMDAKSRFDNWLLRLVRDPTPAPLTRQTFGRIAGRLGDPRPGIVPSGWTSDHAQSIELDPKRDFAWVSIPADAFRPGSDKDDQLAYDDEHNGEPVPLRAFAITRFAITQGQFAAFTRAGGYGSVDDSRPPDWWRFSDEAPDWWHGGNPGLEQWLADPDFPEEQQDAYRQYLKQRGVAARRRPWFQGEPRYADWVLPNHPVIGVSWFEAMAFCRWLTGVWREQGLLGADELIRLPTEIEWERVARGMERRRWPWGDDWREGAANTEEAGLQSTTAVGLFPWPSPDADPAGAMDMAGNVREWTLTRWGGAHRQAGFRLSGGARRSRRRRWRRSAGYQGRLLVQRVAFVSGRLPFQLLPVRLGRLPRFPRGACLPGLILFSDFLFAVFWSFRACRTPR